MSEPTLATAGAVTVTVTRRAAPERGPEVLAWLRAGRSLVEQFPGFLGIGWVKPTAASPDWHVLYRFSDAVRLAAWERSDQRAWWLGSAQGLVEETRTEKRTGIEGWFEPADTVEVAAPKGPPRWKQGTVIWLGFFPVNVVMALLLGLVTDDVPLVPRIAITSLACTPVMVYVVLPRLTRALGWWLQGAPPPWRRGRG